MQECYEAIGGNYEDVLRRLCSEVLIPEIYIESCLKYQSYSTVKAGFGI